MPGVLGDSLSGPEIRAVRLGQALAVENEVTLLAPGAESDHHEGLPVVPFSRRALLREARRHDVVMASTVPPFALALKRQLGILAVSDQYDPVEIELGTLGEGARRATMTAAAARRLQLRCADLVLCAGDRQRQLLEAEVESLELASPPPVRVVPFGIDAPPPPAAGTPLRDRFPQIGADDKVVLWWGSLWRWLDAETAIRSVASLADSRPDLKLVFTAGRIPNGDAERHSVLAEARALAEQLGVLDHSVLFLEEWVPFARRAEYIADADVGLTLHRHADEASLAARARYMDYLVAGLPCVLGRGDETADRFERAGFARLVPAADPDAVATALLGLLEPDAATVARRAGRELADEFRWDRVAAPLLEALREGPTTEQAGSPQQLRRTTAYYARRLADHVLPSS
ncbi:MAG: glycosyltransferase family 4 protein [Solirubrobacterales bacterium]